MGRTSAKVRATKSRQNFFNEHTRSTPLDHKLMFWCDSYYLGASGTFWLPYKSQYKTVWVSAKVREWNRVGIFRTERTRSTPLDPKLMFWCLLFYLGVFGTVWLSYDNRGKTGRTSAKVHATKSRQNFSHRTHSIHPLYPKLVFWYISYYMGVFGTVWVPYETQWKTGRISAKVRAKKSWRNFLQRMHLIHHIGP